jgi:mono/diheme cytochrome c family protein
MFLVNRIMHLLHRTRDALRAVPWKKVFLGLCVVVLLLPVLGFGFLWYVSVRPDIPPYRPIDRVVYLDPEPGACRDFRVDDTIRSTMPASAFDKAKTRDPDTSYQGWCEDYRQVYYRMPQGTTFFGLRYDWVANLERPVGRKKLLTRDYMESIGYIYDGAMLPNANNPADLPIGLTWHWDQKSGQKILDVSCAACHSSQLTYRGTALQIDGGSGGHALTSSSPSQFITMSVASLFTTWINPFKFERFADKVLAAVPAANRKAARAELRSAMRQSLREAVVYAWYNKPSLYPTEEGYGRTDGLGRIANTVFADYLDRSNYRTGNAPVNYPHLWDIWQFDWVQWTGSVKQAMARNVNESLGVRARLELKDKAHLFESSAMLSDMHCIETVLQHLKAPRWPDELFGTPDPALAAEGEALFNSTCRTCHGPFRFDWEKADQLIAAGTPKADIVPARPNTCSTCHGPWTGRPGQSNLPDGAVSIAGYSAGQGEQHGTYREQTRRDEVWQVAHIYLGYVGTDPTSIMNFINYTYDLSALKDTPAGRAVTVLEGEPACNPLETGCYRYISDWQHVPGALGLRFIGGEVRYNNYSRLGIWDLEKRAPREGKADAVADLNGFGEHDRPMGLKNYRPRPLEGVWATAPFLHNGSVPTIYQLLLPPDERDAVFYLGRKEYDPAHLGLVTQPFPGAFRYDTRITGNSNRGHAFDDGLCGNGVIGLQREDRPGYCRRLTEHERLALLEYLKVLSDEPRIDPGTEAHCEFITWPEREP